jgi:chromosome segregation ATPase
VEGRANLEAASEFTKSKLERTQLQLDGAQTKNSELERLNDELKRTNTDLTRQLEKWQSLETKEGEAADTERKQRIALEMELRELTDSSEKKLAKAAAELERANARVERMKVTVQDWEVS